LPLLSAEAVVRADPDVILHPGVVSSQSLSERPGWSSIKAVKMRRVLSVNENLFSRAGPHILDAWETLLDLLTAP
jgi:iron complex transport system substrate-binding protein